MTLKTTLTPHTLGSHALKNRITMSPMTRSRAINNIPNQLMAKYYAQRASAGLIITEGVSPSPNGLGYARMPGIFSQEQIAGWKLITEAVHAKGGKIVIQLMHSGRIGHANNLPAGARIVAPSAITAVGEMWTDKEGMKHHPIPQELDAEELELTRLEFVQSARNAMAAGFDGVELHGANGYLLEQFLSPHTNRRKDIYGGSIENRTRFVLEVASEVADAIGKDKLGIRLSPHSVAGDMVPYAEVDATYTYLAEELSRIGIAYIHVVDHSAMGAPEVPLQLKQAIRNKFKGTFILAGGYDWQKAESHLSSGLADLIGFGRPFINNPDLVERLSNNLPLNPILDASTFYTATEKGYTDYPVYAEETIAA